MTSSSPDAVRDDGPNLRTSPDDIVDDGGTAASLISAGSCQVGVACATLALQRASQGARLPSGWLSSQSQSQPDCHKYRDHNSGTGLGV